MKKVLYITLLIFLGQIPYILGQSTKGCIDSLSNTTLIRNKDLFKGIGVTYPQNFKPRILINNLEKIYAPDTLDIGLAENIFFQQYHSLYTENLSSEQVKKRFWKYNRQYIGYIDGNGDKNILIHLLDFSNPRKAKKYFGKDWQTGFVSFYSESIKLSVYTYRVNLTQSKLLNKW